MQLPSVFIYLFLVKLNFTVPIFAAVRDFPCPQRKARCSIKIIKKNNNNSTYLVWLLRVKRLRHRFLPAGPGAGGAASRTPKAGHWALSGERVVEGASRGLFPRLAVSQEEGNLKELLIDRMEVKRAKGNVYGPCHSSHRRIEDIF